MQLIKTLEFEALYVKKKKRNLNCLLHQKISKSNIREINNPKKQNKRAPEKVGHLSRRSNMKDLASYYNVNGRYKL